jgi:hypothetical protein
MEPDCVTKESVRKTICACARRAQYRLSLTRSNGRLGARRITRETFAGDPPFEAASEATPVTRQGGFPALILVRSCSIAGNRPKRRCCDHRVHRPFYEAMASHGLTCLKTIDILIRAVFSRATECFARESQTVGLAMIERGRPRSLATRRHAPSHRRPASSS